MAYERNERYAPRMVSGSSAYKYAAVPKYADEPQIEYAPKPQQVPRPAKRAQTKYNVSIVSVLGLAIAGILLVLTVFGNIELNRIAVETTRLETRYEKLTEESKKLKISYEEAFDSSEIEEYAVNVLGMTKPTDSQSNVLNVGVNDRATILKTADRSETSVGDVWNFVKSLFAYF